MNPDFSQDMTSWLWFIQWFHLAINIWVLLEDCMIFIKFLWYPWLLYLSYGLFQQLPCWQYFPILLGVGINSTVTIFDFLLSLLAQMNVLILTLYIFWSYSGRSGSNCNDFCIYTSFIFGIRWYLPIINQVTSCTIA